MATFFISEGLTNDNDVPSNVVQELRTSLMTSKYWSCVSVQLDKVKSDFFKLRSSETDLICIIHPGIARLRKKDTARIAGRPVREQKRPELLLDGVNISFSELVALFSLERLSPRYSPVIIFLFVEKLTPEISGIISSQFGIDEFGRTERKIYAIAIPIYQEENTVITSHINTIESVIHTLAEVLPGNKINLEMILDLFPGSKLFFQLNQFDSDDDAAAERRNSFNEALAVTIGKGIEDEVNCTLYAPKEVATGSQFLVQVYIHTDEQTHLLEKLAESADDSSSFRAASILDEKILRKSRIDFNLVVPGLIIDEPVLSTTWNGKVAFVQFGVQVPLNFSQSDLIGKVIVVVKTVPVGQLKFKIKIGPSKTKVEHSKAKRNSGKMVRFRQAFICYASQDRSEVLKRVQMLHLTSLKYFQDLLTLESGEFWEKYIYDYITRCDVFFLFWSTAASHSEWVKREILFALTVQGTRKNASPEIIPVIIEGPPPAKPPEELKFLHFNDKFIFFINPRQTGI